ncbi:RNA methyltransferase [Balneolaceae bacterium ANBcel3]|nr:RNA methyltransferase [Balneolaceae bacterium ANBcel3]
MHTVEVPIDKALSFFSNYVSEQRKNLFKTILEQRTRFFTVVLEDLYQSQNASAVLRSCDAFGIQDVHVVENRNFFNVDKGVTIGADKWLTVRRYCHPDANNTKSAYEALRAKGYQIFATTPHEHQVSLPDFSPEKPTALVFGAEKEGLTDYAIREADGCLAIPMFGFSESYNISVSAALCLYHLRSLCDQNTFSWKLPDIEKKELFLEWLKKSIKRVDALEKKLLTEYGTPGN